MHLRHLVRLFMFLRTLSITSTMFIFRHGGQRAAHTLRPVISASSQRFASRIAIPFTAPAPFPVIDTCPSPTCQCRESPAGLDIEREQNLNGSMAAYAEHVLISTGRSDWKSRIEEEEDAVLVRQLKKLLLRGGKFVDVRGRSLWFSCCGIEADCSSVAIPQCHGVKFIH